MEFRCIFEHSQLQQINDKWLFVVFRCCCCCWLPCSGFVCTVNVLWHCSLVKNCSKQRLMVHSAKQLCSSSNVWVLVDMHLSHVLLMEKTLKCRTSCAKSSQAERQWWVCHLLFFKRFFCVHVTTVITRLCWTLCYYLFISCEWRKLIKNIE